MNEKKLHIVLLEDDRFQREDFKGELESALPGVRVETFSCGENSWMHTKNARRCSPICS